MGIKLSPSMAHVRKPPALLDPRFPSCAPSKVKPAQAQKAMLEMAILGQKKGKKK